MTAPISTVESMITDVQAMAAQLQAVASTLLHMGEALAVFANSPEDLWVREYGEAVTAVKAAKMIGRTPQTISNMVKAGTLPRTPDGNILVRDLARWANSLELKEERSKPASARIAR